MTPTPVTLHRRGFSLVEILVVIAIIAVLAAAAFPIAGKVQHSNNLKKNQAIVTALSNAIDRFQAEYDYLPAPDGAAPGNDTEYTGTELGKLLLELEGKDDNLVLNHKGINFLDAVPAAENGKNGIIRRSGRIYEIVNVKGDPIYVTLDYDFDDTIKSPTKIENREIKGQNALVWTFGHREKNADKEQVLDSASASWR